MLYSKSMGLWYRLYGLRVVGFGKDFEDGFFFRVRVYGFI